jgi:hypothetical protein
MAAGRRGDAGTVERFAATAARTRSIWAGV